MVAVTDGVAIGVDRYGAPADWPTAIELASDNPARLLDMVHAAEATDPHGDHWPRSKRHDQAIAIAVLRRCQ